MGRVTINLATALLFIPSIICTALGQKSAPSEPDWSVNMTVMETCSCPVFCQCFFTGKPPADCSMNMGGGEKMNYCRLNQAYRVNGGQYGSVRLDGAEFWFAGDAGDDFAHPKLEWAVLTFDRAVTPEQQDALKAILNHLHFYRPERWKSYAMGKSAAMKWIVTNDSAKASLDGGKTAEVVLRRMDGGMNDKPVTMNNMDYFGYPRNTGFLLMPNEIEAYRVGDKAFEYKGTNGLVTTVEIASSDIKK
jgi:hypothetical protein